MIPTLFGLNLVKLQKLKAYRNFFYPVMDNPPTYQAVNGSLLPAGEHNRFYFSPKFVVKRRKRMMCLKRRVVTDQVEQIPSILLVSSIVSVFSIGFKLRFSDTPASRLRVSASITSFIIYLIQRSKNRNNKTLWICGHCTRNFSRKSRQRHLGQPATWRTA